MPALSTLLLVKSGLEPARSQNRHNASEIVFDSQVVTSIDFAFGSMRVWLHT